MKFFQNLHYLAVQRTSNNNAFTSENKSLRMRRLKDFL